MKKVSLLSMAIVLVAQVSFAQIFTSSFENWSGPNSPDGWMGSATHTQYLTINQSVDANSGDYSCQLVTSGADHRRFSTQPLAVTAGTVYTITFYLKGAGEIRTGLVNAPFGGTDYQAYNGFIDATPTWTQHTQNITASLTGDVQFIFSVLETAAPDHILIDDVSISAATVLTVPIYDIQFTTDVSGASPLVGQTVTTVGVVTGFYTTASNQHGYFIQDAPGAWNGVHVFQGTNSNLPSIGNEVQVTGTVAEFNGLTQLTGVSTTVLNTSVALPDPVEISTLALSTEEMYEGVLVRVMDVECTEQNSGFGMWEINDGSGAAKVHGLMYTFAPTLGAEYNIIGVVNYSFDEFRICPRNMSDIDVLNSNVNPVSIYDIQFTTDVSGASPLVGQTVMTSGIVTAVWPSEGFFIQDETGPWNGIFVFNTSINPTLGDEIELTGNVVEYFGLTQISSVSAHAIVSTGNVLPAAAVISTQAANSEQYESVLVRVENATCTNTNSGFGMFTINTGNGDMLVDDDIYAFTPTLGNGYNAQGVMWYSFGEYKMLSRFESDIETVGFASVGNDELNNLGLFPNPASESLNFVNFDGQVNILDAQGRLVLTAQVDASNNQIDVQNLESGVYFAMLNGKAMRFVKK